MEMLPMKHTQGQAADINVMLPDVIEKVFTTNNFSQSLEAFSACHLVPLGENPGLHPIRIREILRWIAREVIVAVESSERSFHVCTWDEARCKSIIQAIAQNLQKMIRNSAPRRFFQRIYLSQQWNLASQNWDCMLSKYVWNCYNLPFQLFINDRKDARYIVGITRGDPSAMVIYAIIIISLILI